MAKNLRLSLGALVLVALVGAVLFPWTEHSSAPPDESPVARRNDSKREANGPAPDPPGPKTRLSGAERANSIALTPELAKQRMADINRISDINERAMQARQIIIDLCRSGYSREAWELINEQAGQVRNFQLYAFFSEAELSQPEMLQKITSLQEDGYQGDQSTGLMAYMERFGVEQLEALVESPDFATLATTMSGRDSIQFRNTIEAYFLAKIPESSPDDVLKLLGSAEEFRSKNLLDNENLINILQRSGSVDVFERWQILTKAVEGPTKDPDGARAKFIREMVQTDAPKALDLIVRHEGDRNGADLFAGLRQWNQQEPDAVAQWYISNQRHLTPEQLDVAASAFFESAMDYNERESAIRWAELIQDPERKSRALDRVGLKSRQN